MGDTKTADVTLEDTKATAPEAELDTKGESPEDTAAAHEDATDSQPSVDDLLRQLRDKGKSEKSLRDRLKGFEKAEAERKQADMTEADKLRADREAFDNERKTFTEAQREFTAKSQVITEAQRAGFKVSPERVFALVKADIVFDDDGKPTNVGTVIAALAKEEPGLVGATNGSPTNPDRQKGQGLTAADIRKMSRDEVAALPKEVLDAVSF